jgi:hypothetical protein
VCANVLCECVYVLNPKVEGVHMCVLYVCTRVLCVLESPGIELWRLLVLGMRFAGGGIDLRDIAEDPCGLKLFHRKLAQKLGAPQDQLASITAVVCAPLNSEHPHHLCNWQP